MADSSHKIYGNFNASALLQYLQRSPNEVLHQVIEHTVTKAIRLENQEVLIHLSIFSEFIEYTVLSNISNVPLFLIGNEIKEWFDLHYNLEEFKALASKDLVLKNLVVQFPNLRIVRVTDLFEAICWSIIGQQINLTFAYQCKRALIEKVDRHLLYEGQKYYLFPQPSDLLAISDTEYKLMKFSSQKVKYLREVSAAILNGTLPAKKTLERMPYEMAKKQLTHIKGIGEWSANYVCMRCLGFRDAFPLADVGIHNALKLQLGRSAKPSIPEIKEIAAQWKGHEAYACFYLWQSLL